MKKLKKVFAVLLTLAMVLGMSITSFAAPQTGTITVDNLNGNKVNVSYAKILERDEAGKWVFAEGVTEDVVGMSVEQLTAKDASLQNLELDTLTYISMGSSKDGSITSEALPAGLYAIKAVDSTNEYVYSYMVAAIDYENGVIQPTTVTAKGQRNQPEKEIVNAKDASVAAGDEVEFKITVHYPTFVTNSIEKKMVITDTVTNATINKDSVKIPEGTGLSVDETTTTATQLVITLNADAYNANLAGNEIEITYKVTVDAADALTGTGAVSNKVNTVIPDAEGNEVPRQAIVNIPTVKAAVTKANKDADGHPAITGSSATFELYKEVKEGTAGAIEVETINGSKLMVLVDTKDTDENTGVATFKGLDASETYYVKEKVAPEGFAVEPKAYPLTGAVVTPGEPGTAEMVEGVMTVTTNHSASDFTDVGFGEDMKFLDTNLSALPETGGIGTTIFTIGGCVIMIAAAALFFASRRKSAK